MSILNKEQSQQAIEAMRTYLDGGPTYEGKTPVVSSRDWDSRRKEVISKQLLPLLDRFLAGKVAYAEFKSTVDSFSKKEPHWGFRGMKGQMFFNMITNVATDLEECDQELKAAIRVPENDTMARSRIRSFASYVKRLGEEFVDGGGGKQGAPKIGSIPFFLSFFWQIQKPEEWPIYYTNGVNTLLDINLWTPKQDLADDYVTFKAIHHELTALFSKESGRPFTLYDVEHVFWFVGKQPYTPSKKEADTGAKPTEIVNVESQEPLDRLTESYVPPIVTVLPLIAINDPEAQQAAKRSGLTIDRAFEKNINAAFTIIGYETKLLGQGQGRVPDGWALNIDDSYAIIWDAKVRTDGYSIGTDDRAIREYVATQSRELKRRKRLRNIYYAIISSRFKDDYEDTIRTLKMETDISEVCLMEASALVAMVDQKLRAPLDVSLGPDGLQQLFSNSGILTAEDVQGLMG